MIEKYRIGGLNCLCCAAGGKDRIAYVLYPMDILTGWIESASVRYRTAIVVITGMDWDDDLTPWPAKGVPAGSPDFKGEGREFLEKLQSVVIPTVENRLGVTSGVCRALVGVSLSGLFTLWQWVLTDMFRSIASLSGSFWYEGFIEWIREQPIPRKSGSAYFLLGDREAYSPVKAFDSVAANTEEIVSLLKASGIAVTFESVSGDHYADPIPRLEKAFSHL